jgi:hypothetical protein
MCSGQLAVMETASVESMIGRIGTRPFRHGRFGMPPPAGAIGSSIM